MNPEIERLAKKITPERFEKMKRVLENRTRKITVVLEDIFQPHNASAVLRNCDAFGLQDATFIENKYLHRESRSVDMGAGKWLTVRRFVCGEAVVPKNGMPRKHLVSAAAEENTLRAISDLRSRGYKLVASTLRGGAGGLDEIPVNEPLALLIGTERLGLSDVAHSCADYAFSMPMSGFAQSFNLSVFSALCLANLTRRMRELDDSWKLSSNEKEAVLLEWLSSRG